MALRPQPQTTTTPDVEEARAELDVIEGNKKAAQNEVLVIAADRKRVEEERNDTIARLDTEIETKQKESRDAMATHVKLVGGFVTARYEAEEARDKALADKQVAEESRDLLRREVTVLSTSKISLSTTLEAQSKRQKDLEYSIDALKNEERREKDRLDTTRRQRINEEDLYEEATKKHIVAKIALNKEKQDHEDLTITRADKEQAIIRLDEVMTAKRAEIAQLTTDIADLQKKKSDQEKEIVERDRDSNERMHNATLLEQTITRKLQDLKDIENHYAVGELAKAGYKRIGT